MKEIVTQADLITFLQKKIDEGIGDVKVTVALLDHITAMLYQFRYIGVYHLPKDLMPVIFSNVDQARPELEHVACNGQLLRLFCEVVGILVQRRTSRMFSDDYLPLLVEAMNYPGLTTSSVDLDYLVVSSAEFETQFGIRINCPVRSVDRYGRVLFRATDRLRSAPQYFSQL